MRFPFPFLVALLALLIPTGVIAAEAVVAPEPVQVSITGIPWLDLTLGIIGLINALATGLAALLPGNSTVGLIAKLANLANTVGVTLKPKAVQAPTPVPPKA